MSITIPCVVGTYTNVPVRFTLLNSKLRTTANAETPLTQGPAFANGGLSASSAANDAGQLELDFRDAKYLPSEGGGAISEWSLQLPSEVKSFDYNTISGVILQLSYTAEYDATLRGTVEEDIAGKIPNAFSRLVSVREEFPDVWYELKQLESEGSTDPFTPPANLAPYFMRGGQVDKVEYYDDGSSINEPWVGDSNTILLEKDMKVPQEDGKTDIFLRISYSLPT